ncbi:MAG: methylmalonyl-CoA mutase family protein, partial [Acidobacteriota bacterium]
MAEEATDFAPLTFEDWLAKVSKDLRGGDPEKILAYREPDGLGLRALEDEQTAPTDSDPAGFPGRAPYARGTRLPRAQGGAGDWGVGLEIDCASLQKARHFVHHDLQLGASALRLRLADGGIEVRDLGGFAELLEGVDASLIELHLDLGPRPLLAAGLLDAWCRRGDTAPGDLRGSLGVDAMASLAVAGELPDSPAAIYAGLAEAGRWCREQTPGMRAGLLSSAAFHEAGASPVQELAFTLASGVETLRRLDDAGLEPADAAPQLLTAHAVGRDVFLEIAKLRAWRLVWTRVLEALGAADAAGQ